MTVTYQIAGQLPNPGGGYVLHWVHQPMVNPDRISVTVRSVTGEPVDDVSATDPVSVSVSGDGTTATFTGAIDRDIDLSVTFD